MAVASAASQDTYSGNGTTTVFAYNFKITDEDHLSVVVADADGDETTLTKTTHYTVSGVNEASGGNVTTVDLTAVCADVELPTGWTMSIRRVVPITQTTDLSNQGTFFNETHEEVFDKLVMIAQQQQNELDRCPKVDETSGDTGASLMTTIKGYKDDAETAESNASASATAAAASASAAASSAGAASTSATNAASSASSASTAQTASEAAQSAAETAQSAAETAQSAAETAQSAAETAQSAAETAETNAASSASTATTKASEASASASAASTSASNASTSETNAAASASAAATSETNAANSASSFHAEETLQSIGAGGTISLNANARIQSLPVQGDSGAQTASNTPFGASPPSGGTLLFLIGQDDTNTLTLSTNDAADGCLLNGTATLKRGEVLQLIYSEDLDRYVEVGRTM